MSLGERRQRVRQQAQIVDALGAATRARAGQLQAHAERYAPWLWLGAGALVGVSLERAQHPPSKPKAGRSSARPAASAPATLASLLPTLLGALPWPWLLARIEQSLQAAGAAPAAPSDAAAEPPRDASTQAPP